jgi:hypothetical protein
LINWQTDILIFFKVLIAPIVPPAIQYNSDAKPKRVEPQHSAGAGIDTFIATLANVANKTYIFVVWSLVLYFYSK